VITGAEDGTVRVLDARELTLEDLIAWTRANRYYVQSLTCEQQRQFHLDLGAECAA
jgi:hypothetical protein